MVSDLYEAYPGRLAVVEYHVFGDGFDAPWGQQRLSDFYVGWCGDVLPIIVYDGYWFWYEAGDFTDGLRDRLGEPTDVTIELSAREVRDAVWTVMAEVSIEPGGSRKRMRIYTVDTLDHYPDDPSYSRNTLRQAAPTQDIDLDAGECAVVESTFQFDDTQAGAVAGGHPDHRLGPGDRGPRAGQRLSGRADGLAVPAGGERRARVSA